MYFEKYTQISQWRWRLKSANHETIASGESYWNETDCDHAISLIKGTNASTPVHKV
ncbi:MAG: YegP family protein [Pseudomonadota bacterium]